MQDLRSYEWLNQNSLRHYPFKETASLQSLEPDGIGIPLGLFVDLILLVPAATALPCYLSVLSFTGRLLSLIISDAGGTVLASSTIDTAQYVNYLSAPLLPIASGVSGTVVLGDGTLKLGEWPRGVWRFSPSATELETRVCLPVAYGPVTSVGDENDLRTLTGDVRIEAGDNVMLEYDTVDNAIVVSLRDPVPFTPECNRGCTPGTCARQPILTINGIAPDANGNFVLEGTGVVRITSENRTIKLMSTVWPEDLCENALEAPPGRPGPPGPDGADGAGGRTLCFCSDWVMFPLCGPGDCPIAMEQDGTLVQNPTYNP